MVLALSGCAASDPIFFFSIGPPVPDKKAGPAQTVTESRSIESTQSANSMATCSVQLDDIASTSLDGTADGTVSPKIPQPYWAQDTPYWAQDMNFKVYEEPTETNPWTIRKLQIKFEYILDHRIIQLDTKECKRDKKSLFTKWLVRYSRTGTDPDQNFVRFQEYLESLKMVSDLTNSGGIKASSNVMGQNDRSFWCGNPKNSQCSDLYKVITKPAPGVPLTKNLVNELLSHLNCAKGVTPATPPTIETASNEKPTKIASSVSGGAFQCGSTNKPEHFLVLGYEMPWDRQHTEIRYGVAFFFEEVGETTKFLGHVLSYANEATPEIQMPSPVPFYPGKAALTEGANRKDEYAPESLSMVSTEQQWTRARPWMNQLMYATGYPFALTIGIKNAAFELAKMPISWVEGILGGRDEAWDYPKENAINAWKALSLEAFNLPSYSLLPGIHQLITELPLVGQIFQLNTGPEHREWDLSPDRVQRKIFLSRGIYGGDEAGQDTGLWAARTAQIYPNYEVHAVPYKHGTAIDVVWSMFNLSHGPGYAEAKYVMEHAGPFDHLYLSGHSGGVQRSAAASRILSNHGLSVQRILGISGPSIGQAYVDTRYPNSFHIYLNTQSGMDQDVVGRIGALADGYSTLMSYLTVIPLKYVAGFLTAPSVKVQRCAYELFDHVGFSNAVITEVPRKRSTLHQTPLRLSLAEPIIFDAYVRDEYEVAFREDLMRPSDHVLPKLLSEDGSEDQDILGKRVVDTRGCTLWDSAEDTGTDRGGALFRWEKH